MNKYFESCARYQDIELSFNEKFIGWMFAQNWKVPEDLQYDCAFLCMGVGTVSETVEMFQALKEYKRNKRRENTKQSTALLQQKNIEFDSRNSGAHLIITAPEGRIVDFWPSTGLWRYRDSDREGRGIHSLIKELKHVR